MSDIQDYQPYFYDATDGKIAMSVLGPRDGDHYAGEYTIEELEAVGVKAIQAAQKRRDKTVGFTPEETEQMLSALQAWAKHLTKTVGALPVGQPAHEATNSAYSKLLAQHGPENTRKTAA